MPKVYVSTAHGGAEADAFPACHACCPAPGTR